MADQPTELDLSQQELAQGVPAPGDVDDDVQPDDDDEATDAAD